MRCGHSDKTNLENEVPDAADILASNHWVTNFDLRYVHLRIDKCMDRYLEDMRREICVQLRPLREYTMYT